MSTDDVADNPLDFDDYYSATQMRSDRWSAFKDTAKRLQQFSEAGRDVTALRRKADSILASLEPIEAYWAFPARAGFEYLKLQLARGNYVELSGR